MKPTLLQRLAQAGPKAGVAAAVLALAALGTGAALAAMPGHHGMHGGPGAMGMGPGGPMLSPRMLDSVNATAEQKARIETLTSAARDDLRKLHEAGRSLHEQALSLLAAPTVDAAALEALRQQQLAQHDQASRRMMQAMVDVANVLTPAQRQQLAERAKQRRAMAERHQRERDAVDPAPTR